MLEDIQKLYTRALETLSPRLTETANSLLGEIHVEGVEAISTLAIMPTKDRIEIYNWLAQQPERENDTQKHLLMIAGDFVKISDGDFGRSALQTVLDNNDLGNTPSAINSRSQELENVKETYILDWLHTSITEDLPSFYRVSSEEFVNAYMDDRKRGKYYALLIYCENKIDDPFGASILRQTLFRNQKLTESFWEGFSDASKKIYAGGLKQIEETATEIVDGVTYDWVMNVDPYEISKLDTQECIFLMRAMMGHPLYAASTKSFQEMRNRFFEHASIPDEIKQLRYEHIHSLLEAFRELNDNDLDEVLTVKDSFRTTDAQQLEKHHGIACATIGKAFNVQFCPTVIIYNHNLWKRPGTEALYTCWIKESSDGIPKQKFFNTIYIRYSRPGEVVQAHSLSYTTNIGALAHEMAHAHDDQMSSRIVAINARIHENDYSEERMLSLRALHHGSEIKQIDTNSPLGNAYYLLNLTCGATPRNKYIINNCMQPTEKWIYTYESLTSSIINGALVEHKCRRNPNYLLNSLLESVKLIATAITFVGSDLMEAYNDLDIKDSAVTKRTNDLCLISNNPFLAATTLDHKTLSEQHIRSLQDGLWDCIDNELISMIDLAPLCMAVSYASLQTSNLANFKRNELRAIIPTTRNQRERLGIISLHNTLNVMCLSLLDLGEDLRDIAAVILTDHDKMIKKPAKPANIRKASTTGNITSPQAPAP